MVSDEADKVMFLRLPTKLVYTAFVYYPIGLGNVLEKRV